MKHDKKPGLGNKLFLIGLGVLSAVGVVAAASSHMSSLGCFDNIFMYRNYNVTMQNLVLDSEAAAAETNKELNAEVIVENTGDIPILTRISYINSDKVAVGEYDKKTVVVNRNSEGKIIDSDEEVVELLDLDQTINGYVENTESGENAKSSWKAKTLENSNFERGDDGCYYYKGILEKGDSVKHLDKVILESEIVTYSPPQEQIFYKAGNGVEDYNNVGWESDVPDDKTEIGRKSVVKFGSSPYCKLNLTVVIETIQAADADFVETKDKFPQNPTAEIMKGYWDELMTKK